MTCQGRRGQGEPGKSSATSTGQAGTSALIIHSRRYPSHRRWRTVTHNDLAPRSAFRRRVSSGLLNRAVATRGCRSQSHRVVSDSDYYGRTPFASRGQSYAMTVHLDLGAFSPPVIQPHSSGYLRFLQKLNPDTPFNPLFPILKPHQFQCAGPTLSKPTTRKCNTYPSYGA